MRAVEARMRLALARHAGDGQRVARPSPRAPTARRDDRVHVGVGHRRDQDARLPAIGHEDSRRPRRSASTPRLRAMSPSVRPAWSGRCGETATRTTSQDGMRPKLVSPFRAMSSRMRRADVAAAEPLEHRRDAAVHDPAREQVAQRVGGGVVGIGVAVHRHARGGARPRSRASSRRGAAPVVDAGELQVRDLHVHAGGLGDGDRLAHGVEDVVGLVAHVRGVGGAVARGARARARGSRRRPRSRRAR